ncbi:MAG: YegS/Rv2252/BmrU family lipid kinase [Elusimicrobia bacterium]|nr:YegS/Rv2252/BmrU family lipid kinase [Elusimicrobiota bacterium]
MKSVLLLNPAAGNGRAARRWETARAAVQSSLGALQVLTTARRGHGPELVRAALDAGAQRIFAFGGDGTWNEAVAGFFAAAPSARAGAALAPLPAGSGCDFARHLGLPLDPAAAAALLAGAAVRRIDALRAEFAGASGRETRHLTNMAGVGLAADAAALVERHGKPLGGTLSYLAAVVWSLCAGGPRTYRLSLDGVDASGRYYAVLVANTETTGGGMRAAPGADLFDGRVEVLTVAALPKPALLFRLAKLYDGSHLGTPGVRMVQARKVEIESTDGTAGLNIDGETAGTLPARFEVLPAALPVLVPAVRNP